MNDQDLKKLWKDQPASTIALSPDELRKQARTFQRRIRSRNVRESLAALFVIAGFGYCIWAFAFPLMQIGSVLTILGTLVVMHQLHHRASSRPLPEANVGVACLQFHRAELVRQRDALRAVWLWYIGPLVPGMVVFRWGVETQLDASAPFTHGLVANLLIVAVMLCVAGLNLAGARKLQRQIDRLDRESADQT